MVRAPNGTISRHDSISRTACIDAVCALFDTCRGRPGRGPSTGCRTTHDPAWLLAMGGCGAGAARGVVPGSLGAPAVADADRSQRPFLDLSTSPAAPPARSRPSSPRPTDDGLFRRAAVGRFRYGGSVARAIGGTVRETSPAGGLSPRRDPFPSHLEQHRQAERAPGRHRAGSTAETLRAPNEDRRRTGRAGRSATFRPPPEGARAGQHAASRRDGRPAIPPAC